MRYVLDIETNALENPSVIHCVVCRNIDNPEEYHVFKEPVTFRDFCKDVTLWVGHNIIQFDWVWLIQLWGITLPAERVRDTLILSQLLYQGIEGGHSLEAWGERLGVPKRGTGITDFSVLSNELLERCIQDTKVNLDLYAFLIGKLDRPEFREAIDVEHRMAFICLNMHLDGFKYNYTEATKLHKELCEQLSALDHTISKEFKPKIRVIKEVTPRYTKDGTLNRSDFRWYKGNDLSVFNGGPFVRFEYVAFDPNSIKQCVELLTDAGWSPINKTKTGKGYKLDEQNLATLPETAPVGLKSLVLRMLIAARIRTLETWAKAYSPVTGRIHGRFHTLGTYTHRMAHRNPNMGNISAKKSIKYKDPQLKELATNLGGQMRSLWICDDDCWLVGTDMEGAHLRLLAHYMDDPVFTKALLQGKTELGTDVHSRNRDALGFANADRDLAKTFIYSFLNGAGKGKVAEIFGCSLERAAHALEQFVQSYPGLRRLREDLFPQWASQGYFPGLDGRLVVCDSEHLMMAALLQNGEAVVMKHANVMWRKELRDRGIQFRQVNFVHDEFQTEVRGSREVAERVGAIQAECIKRVGERFQLRCPLAGKSTVGKNWLETH